MHKKFTKGRECNWPEATCRCVYCSSLKPALPNNLNVHLIGITMDKGVTVTLLRSNLAGRWLVVLVGTYLGPSKQMSVYHHRLQHLPFVSRYIQSFDAEVSSLFIASNHNATKVKQKFVLMLRKLMTVLTGNVQYS